MSQSRNESQSSDVHNLPTGGRWFEGLTRYHWFVFSMAGLAWMFDCFDQQIFVNVRGLAMKGFFSNADQANDFGQYSTSIFLAGWALGGLIFGSLGDRVGRARMLSITVLLYSVFTGLSAFSQTWVEFAIYRFITGLGVGGVFGLAVALIADTLPDRSRPGALGILQSLSTVGNIGAGLIVMALGNMSAKADSISSWVTKENSWRIAFVIGAIPAFLCVFIQWRLKEPEKWVAARELGKTTGARFGSYASLLGESRWRTPAILGMLLCVSGVIGLWGIGFFAPELVGGVIENDLAKSGLLANQVASQKTFYIGINSIIANVGGFFGMVGFSMLAQRIGRRITFVIAFVGALLTTNLFFQTFNGVNQLWLSGLMGFFQFSLFSGFAIYLPELFPIRLRSTGVSFCYNVGRIVAAMGPLIQVRLQDYLRTNAVEALGPGASAEVIATAKLNAFRNAISWASLVFLLGVVVILMLHETKGKPLPEDQ